MARSAARATVEDQQRCRRPPGLIAASSAGSLGLLGRRAGPAGAGRERHRARPAAPLQAPRAADRDVPLTRATAHMAHRPRRRDRPRLRATPRTRRHRGEVQPTPGTLWWLPLIRRRSKPKSSTRLSKSAKAQSPAHLRIRVDAVDRPFRGTCSHSSATVVVVAWFGRERSGAPALWASGPQRRSWDPLGIKQRTVLAALPAPALKPCARQPKSRCARRYPWTRETSRREHHTGSRGRCAERRGTPRTAQAVHRASAQPGWA